MKKVALVVGLFIAANVVVSVGFAGAAQAATGNAQAGQAKAAVCAACHGTDGNSASDMYPKIAGQHESYLFKQLMDYKRASETGGAEGRNNAIMSAQVMFLSEQDMADLAAYFAGQKPMLGEAPEEVIAAASKFYMGGDAERKIPACVACHGPRGDGMALAKFPDISGQHATYTIDQLKQFRSGQRANDPNGMMRDIAAKLTDQDMELLAKYLQGLY